MSADDWVKIIGAIGASLVLVLGSIGALYVKVVEYRREVDGKMGQLLELTRRSAHAEGRLEGSPPPTSSSQANEECR